MPLSLLRVEWPPLFLAALALACASICLNVRIDTNPHVAGRLSMYLHLLLMPTEGKVASCTEEHVDVEVPFEVLAP
jgi:hypothetical protein